MSKAINALKVWMFRRHFKLTESEKNGLRTLRLSPVRESLDTGSGGCSCSLTQPAAAEGFDGLHGRQPGCG